MADVIPHLIWDIEYDADFIVSRALRGDLSPLPDQPEGDTVAALDELATRAILRRASLGEQLRESFTKLVAGMNASFAARTQKTGRNQSASYQVPIPEPTLST